MHHYLYEDVYGPVPDGLVVRHKCDERMCVNIDHLELGTYKDNMKDRSDRGRCNTHCGETRADAKLTLKQVLEIQEAKGIQREIAEKYGVSQSRISTIKSGKGWPKR